METFEKVKAWLQDDSQDYAEGATLMLQVTMNRVLHQNVMRNPEGFKDIISYHLETWVKARTIDETHAQVEEMRAKATVIAANRRLEEPKKKEEVFQAGRRPDHDSLPEEVRALFVENFALIARMRVLHLKVSEIARQGATCLDSEQYPFLKELIEADRKLAENWKVYDNYDFQQEERKGAEKERLKNLKVLNLLKGRYRKNPDGQTAERMTELLRNIPNPPEKLVEELKELGFRF